MRPIHSSQIQQRIWPILLGGAILTPAAGCGDSTVSQDSEAETVRQQEALIEVAVGAFRVPLIGCEPRLEEEGEAPERNRLLLRFQLYALVPPARESAVLHRIETHQARLRDEVSQVCRLASLDELSEPALATLKAQLTTVVGKYVGPRHLRRIVLTNVLLEAT